MDIQANEIMKKEVIAAKNLTLDIQAILAVIGRRKYSFEYGETNCLDLSITDLHDTNLLRLTFPGLTLLMPTFLGLTLFKLTFP